MFSTDSPKAIKSLEYGYLNAILYLAPHEYAGVGNLCPHASPACIAACLGLHSGQASMVKSEKKKDANSVRKSRALKARYFMLKRDVFMRHLVLDIARNWQRATRAGLRLAIRLNGSSDIAYEGIRFFVDADTATRVAKITRGALKCYAGTYGNIFAAFPSIQFLDYTKNPHRMRRALPANYHLTFSRSESNDFLASDVLLRGGNVAAVFDRLPESYGGFRVINGDSHDLRFLDPQNVIVGLTPKGSKAKRDKSGFVIRLAA
ncbi:MAG: GP88 family protein [Burkholderiaceae bacterium]